MKDKTEPKAYYGAKLESNELSNVMCLDVDYFFKPLTSIDLTPESTIRNLQEKLSAKSALDVRIYANETYPEFRHFQRGSKQSMINNIIAFEENKEILNDIERRAKL